MGLLVMVRMPALANAPGDNSLAVSNPPFLGVCPRESSPLKLSEPRLSSPLPPLPMFYLSNYRLCEALALSLGETKFDPP